MSARNSGRLFAAARMLLLAVVLGLLAGCKLATPFRGPAANAAEAVPGSTAVVVLTRITLGDDAGKNSLFWKHTLRVIESLPSQPGYLGHSVRRELFGNQAWTMTAWSDEASLRGFVQSQAHQAAIREGLPAAAGVRFARVNLDHTQIPISWDQAEKILREQGRGY